MVISISKTFFNKGFDVFYRCGNDLTVTDGHGNDQINSAAAAFFIRQCCPIKIIRTVAAGNRKTKLLQNTQMSMGEIQAVCGFESPSYFSRAFKAEYGISPSDFRKKRGNI